MAKHCYNVILRKDYRLAQNITTAQLQYVLTIAWISRLVQCANTLGYANIDGESQLKRAAKAIQLPNILAQYIEALGRFELSSGAVIAPYAHDYRQLFPIDSPLMMDPADLLDVAGRPVPDGPWPIDKEWILEYNEATTRAARSGMGFRLVDNSTYEGRVEMVVSYRQDDEGLYTPFSPQRIAEAEAHLGAIYRYRDMTETLFWPGTNHELVAPTFTGNRVDPDIGLSDLLVASFKGTIMPTS